MNSIIWKPDNPDNAMALYRHYVNKNFGKKFEHYSELHHWSVTNSNEFWDSLFDYFAIKYDGSRSPIYTRLDFAQDFSQDKWFPSVTLNFAENLLAHGRDTDIALDFYHESGMQKKLTYQDLRNEVARLQNFLKDELVENDVFAAFMPNIPETVIAMLAATSLGAQFTSTSCDFGASGVIDRFAETRPKILLAATGYEYNGKYIDLSDRISEIVSRLPSIQKVILVDFLNKGHQVKLQVPKLEWQALPGNETGDEKYKLVFKKFPFAHPLYIMYSSGTTGKPKCIVHSSGGVLLQHIKEIALHTGVTSKKNLYFFTTCGWMMWHWLVSGLFTGAKIVLYEGSPSYPSLSEYLEIINLAKLHYFGTSPKFLRALEDYNPQKKYQFLNLESVISTGAPLLPEQFDYVTKMFAPGKHVASICGGTDIIGCFMLGNPDLPVRKGEIQCLGLGMDVHVFNDKAESILEAEGELVCKQSFPSRPLGFLHDTDRVKFKQAYFNHFPGVWHHGDYILITKSQGVVVFGRSDATLNPGGVRIGTSEIYRYVETLPYVADALCVGKENKKENKGDVDIILFLKLQDGFTLDETKISEIKTLIRKATTPRHVPKFIYAIKDIPYTRSGKKMEIAVQRLLQGKLLPNLEAVANPDSLTEYKKYI